MKRIDPNFKQQTLTAQENLEFIDELFRSLCDDGDISSDTDETPNLSNLDR